jgi:hypothetical protein
VSIEAIVETFKKEWPVISGAPWSFALAVAAVIVLVATAYRVFYGKRLGDLEERLRLRDDQRTAYESVFGERTVGEVGRELAALKQAKPNIATAGRNDLSEDQSLTVVRGKTFRNERVVLDGHKYFSCSFVNVTLVFNGGPFGLEHNNLEGVVFDSDRREIGRTLYLLHSLGLIAVPALPRGGGREIAPSSGLARNSASPSDVNAAASSSLRPPSSQV